MNPNPRGRNGARLFVLILLAIAYGAWVNCRCLSTGTQTLDGAIGVVLGLYICSHPAANAVDRLLFERAIPRRNSSRPSDGVWLALNALALLSGWMVVVMGAIRFAARVD